MASHAASAFPNMTPSTTTRRDPPSDDPSPLTTADATTTDSEAASTAAVGTATPAPKKPRHTRNRSASAPFEDLQKDSVRKTPLAQRSLNANTGSSVARKLDLPKDDVRRVSPSQIEALMRDPDSVPIRPAADDELDGLSALAAHHARVADAARAQQRSRRPSAFYKTLVGDMSDDADESGGKLRAKSISTPRPGASNRALSMPSSSYRRSSVLHSPLEVPSRAVGIDLGAESEGGLGILGADGPTKGSANGHARDMDREREREKARERNTDLDQVAERFASLPLPPMSMPALLELELATGRPSPLYIYRHSAADVPYESTKVKLERLANFLYLPHQLEQVLLFGALSCLDAWLWTFTILPIRFLRALWIILDWFGHNAVHEVMDLSYFIMQGLGRMRQRYREGSVSMSRAPSMSRVSSVSTSSATASLAAPPVSGPKQRVSASRKHSEAGHSKLAANGSATLQENKRPSATAASASASAGYQQHQHQPQHLHQHHRQTPSSSSNSYRHRSNPSILAVPHKADLLQGLLIAVTCAVLMKLDASRMYHAIRGQAAIKLYVIYNCLEVFDRLFSAFGQDVLECLFSNEVLERHPWGRSKIFQPLWLFTLALFYCVVHATSLLYQTVTLNVAVNSYNNALLTLLMSNQFVEIKGAVFKKIEKENLFQLTCADVVERFQLWLMLLVIGLRNLVEVAGFSFSDAFASAGPLPSNSTTSSPTQPFLLLSSIPNISIQPILKVLSPFLIVLASETIVDWLKHAYINKFNATSPRVYGRFLDVLAKDYYTHAFSSPFSGMVRRVGLPVIPLACLFIRATLQTYHMFLAANISPISSSTFTTASTTSLAMQEETEGPGTFSANVLRHVHLAFRQALGTSSLGGGGNAAAGRWTLDDGIALLTMIVFFLALYLILLACKLALGMVLLRAARARYNSMHERALERTALPDSRRVGGWSMAEVGDERRKIIYEDDKKGLQRMREREARAQRGGEGDSRRPDGEARRGGELDGVFRYHMAAKRIW